MRLGVPSIPRRGRRPDPVPPESVAYRERLWVPWWWYPVALGVAAVLAAEFRVAGLSLTVWIPFGVLLPLAVAMVASLGRSRLQVSGGEIRVRGAHLPLEFVSGVIALDAATMRLVVGREGDPAAYVSIRSWVGPGVQLWLDDPDDPTPYWLVSTRHPQELVAVLREQLQPRPSALEGTADDRDLEQGNHGHNDGNQGEGAASLPERAPGAGGGPARNDAQRPADDSDDAEDGEQAVVSNDAAANPELG